MDRDGVALGMSRTHGHMLKTGRALLVTEAEKGQAGSNTLETCIGRLKVLW